MRMTGPASPVLTKIRKTGSYSGLCVSPMFPPKFVILNSHELVFSTSNELNKPSEA